MRLNFGILTAERQFRRLWTAQTISSVGTQISGIAVPLVALVTLHASALSVSVLFALEYAPYVLIGLPAGAWVDRAARRRLVIGADLARAGALAAVPAAAAAGVLSFGLLGTVVAIVGAATVVGDLAAQAFLPELIDRDDLVAGNAALSASRSAASAGGPTSAGWIVAALTAPYAIALDAASYLGSALLVASLRSGRTNAAEPATHQSWRVRDAIAEGLRVVRGDRLLRTLTAYSAITSFAVMVVVAVDIVFLSRTLRLNAPTIGLLLGLSSLGAVAGAGLAGPVRRALGDVRTLGALAALSAVGMLLIPLAGTGPRLALFPVGMGVAEAGIVANNVCNVSLVQQRCPDRLVGRVFATVRFLAWSTPPLGALTGGAIASAAGPRAALGVGGVLFAGAAAALVLAVRRGVSTAPLADPAAQLL